MKRLHKLIMTSTAYRQSSARDPRGADLDPENRLYWRMSVRRLDAETLRDRILAASGVLSETMFGPSVPVKEDAVGQVVVGVDPPQTPEPPAGHEAFRRSIYIQVRRSQPLAMLHAFDQPVMETNCERRTVSTVATQSLMLMNSDFILEQARYFAARVRKLAPDDPRAQVEAAWQMAFTRAPEASELQAAVAFMAAQSAGGWNDRGRGSPRRVAVGSRGGCGAGRGWRGCEYGGAGRDGGAGGRSVGQPLPGIVEHQRVFVRRMNKVAPMSLQRLPTRREFLSHNAMGIGGVALAWLLDQERLLAAPHVPRENQRFDLAPKPPHAPPRARAMISLFMHGGPSHVDLLDPKPELSRRAGTDYPGEVVYSFANRATKKLFGSPWKFARQGQSGTEVSELLPHLAKIVDDIAVIRSMHTDINGHESSIWYMNTGKSQPGRPALGSWLTYALGSESQDLPAYVVLSDPAGHPVDGVRNWSNGWLPPLFQGTVIRPREPRILNLDPPAHLRGQRQQQNLALIGRVEPATPGAARGRSRSRSAHRQL